MEGPSRLAASAEATHEICVVMRKGSGDRPQKRTLIAGTVEP